MLTHNICSISEERNLKPRCYNYRLLANKFRDDITVVTLSVNSAVMNLRLLTSRETLFLSLLI